MAQPARLLLQDVTNCNCLLAAFANLRVPIKEVPRLGLIEAAERLGFQAKGAKGKSESLSKNPLPAIVHVIVKNGLHHYLIIYKVSKTAITIMYPGDGKVYKNR